MSTATAEEAMAKKPAESPEPSPFVTVKVRRPLHAKLAFLASRRGKDIAEVVNGLLEGPTDREYRKERDKADQEEKA